MALRTYIKGVFKPKAAKRAKAMKRAKERARKASGVAEEASYDDLEKALGYKFKNKAILKEALTHPVSVGASKDKVRSNQRLEFLGDAILQAVISSEIFKKFPDEEEGDLTKTRIVLTRGSFLSEMSRGLRIPEHLILPNGMDSLRRVASSAEDSFESIVGAIFVDAGFDKTRDVLKRWYGKRLNSLSELVKTQNPKGALQELAARNGSKIQYVLLSQSGPDHDKVFDVEVLVDGLAFGRGEASSKKSAEVKAASIALGGYGTYLESRKSIVPVDDDGGAEGSQSDAPEVSKCRADD